MKASAIRRIVVYSVLSLLLIGILVSMLAWTRLDWRILHGVGLEGSMGEPIRVDADAVQSLEIHWNAGAVRLSVQDGADLTFAETVQEDFPLIWLEDEGKLIIAFSEENVKSAFNVRTPLAKDLIIGVPRDWVPEEIDINSVDADILVQDITAQELRIHNISGSSRLEDCHMDKAIFGTVSGEMDYTGWIGWLDCTSVSADCRFTMKENPYKLDAKINSADLYLTVPEDFGFNASIDSTSGELITDFSVKKDKREYLSGSGRCTITVRSVSGNLHVLKAR